MSHLTIDAIKQTGKALESLEIVTHHNRFTTNIDRVAAKSKHMISNCLNCGYPLTPLGFFFGDAALQEAANEELKTIIQKKVPSHVWDIPTNIATRRECLGKACSFGCAKAVILNENRGCNAMTILHNYREKLIKEGKVSKDESTTDNNKLILNYYGGPRQNPFFNQTEAYTYDVIDSIFYTAEQTQKYTVNNSVQSYAHEGEDSHPETDETLQSQSELDSASLYNGKKEKYPEQTRDTAPQKKRAFRKSTAGKKITRSKGGAFKF